MHRFSTNGKRGDVAGWYVMHDDGIPAGAFGCWRMGLHQTWSAKPERAMTEAERAAHRERMRAIQREREAEEQSATARPQPKPRGNGRPPPRPPNTRI